MLGLSYTVMNKTELVSILIDLRVWQSFQIVRRQTNIIYTYIFTCIRGRLQWHCSVFITIIWWHSSEAVCVWIHGFKFKDSQRNPHYQALIMGWHIPGLVPLQSRSHLPAQYYSYKETNKYKGTFRKVCPNTIVSHLPKINSFLGSDASFLWFIIPYFCISYRGHHKAA